jgi:integrase/recombinase XerD
MSENSFRRKLRVWDNPFGPVLKRYVAYLVGRGYSATTCREYASVAEHFGRWLGLRSLSHAAARRFVRQHLPACRCPAPVIRNAGRNRRALNHLLAMCGVSVPAAAPPCGFVCDLLRSYAERLEKTQGLAASTVHQRLILARKMLKRLRVNQPGQLARWTPQLIESYVSTAAQRYQPSTAHNIAAGVRSLLRFLLQQGLIDRDLSTAVPTFAHWRLASLPKTLQKEELVRLLKEPNVRTPIGLRDRAILLCLSELGMRASDVAGLELDGVDLTSGVITLRRSKQRKSTALPMTRKLARALAAYLRHGRPACKSQLVFVLHWPPVGKAITPATVSDIVWRLGTRAKLRPESRGAHVLRHTFASSLLRAGASLKQVADLLGHQSIDTTTIYAKVDLKSLSRVALPWPGTKEVRR